MKRLKYNSFKIREEGDIISIERLLLKVENLICILEIIGTTDIKYTYSSTIHLRISGNVFHSKY